ncbi:MAG: glucosaminidase domain-containing protein [Saprospiraceae bacterium]
MINKLVFISFLLVPVIVDANKKLTENYISSFHGIAVSEMRRTGIPASIKLAQGILESDLGRSPLAYQANNHFGIKCGSEWTGKVYGKFDDERGQDGTMIESCFRAFGSAEESYIAHSDFLSNPSKQSRYGFLFELGSTDYVGWANGLKFSGYATDPQYPSKLIKIIELNQLYKYDEQVSKSMYDSNIADESSRYNSKSDKNTKKSKEPQIVQANQRPTNDRESSSVFKRSMTKYSTSKINDVKMVKAKGGESIRELAMTMDEDVFDLLEYNEGLTSQDDLLETGEIIYLQKKKKSYEDGEEKDIFHTVAQGESMYQISQKYGVRLESLLSKNHLKSGFSPRVGELVSLHKNLSKKDAPKSTTSSSNDVFVDLGSLK